MTSREDQILKPRDPSVEDENEWEEFSLTDVKILVPGKSRYANLLATSPENPVRVIGCLSEVEEEQKDLVLDEDYLSKRIVIENVTHYAYGQHDDGEIGVWVAGQAGWFSIVPAKGYKPMFNDIVEAVDLLYFLADRHRNSQSRRKRRGNATEITFEHLCDEYVLHTHGICEDGDDSAEVFYKHSSFLLSQMIQGKEDVQWNETEVFNHLAKKFPHEYKRILALHQESIGEQPVADPDVSSNKETAKVEAVAAAQADSIFNTIMELKESGALAKRQLSLELVLSTLRGQFDLNSDDYARDLVAARSELVIQRMNQSDFDWSRKAIYRDLKQLIGKVDDSKLAITPLRPRTTFDEDTDPSSEHDEDGDEEEEDDAEDSARARRHRMRMSVLRPSTKKAGKKTRSGKTPATARDVGHFSDESDADAEELDTPSKSRGLNLVRDPPSTVGSLNGRALSILSDSESTSLVIRKAPLQEINQAANMSGSSSMLTVHEARSNVVADNLLDDAWICSVEGCDKTIHKASSKRSKELISDHTLTHAEDTQTKLDLVFAEQRLNIGLGVDNLLRRIREFGTSDEVNGDGVGIATKRLKR